MSPFGSVSWLWTDQDIPLESNRINLEGLIVSVRNGNDVKRLSKRPVESVAAEAYSCQMEIAGRFQPKVANSVCSTGSSGVLRKEYPYTPNRSLRPRIDDSPAELKRARRGVRVREDAPGEQCNHEDPRTAL